MFYGIMCWMEANYWLWVDLEIQQAGQVGQKATF